MDSYMGIILLIFLGAVFYFMLIRPQQKRMRQQMELINNLQVGDDVMTSAGIYGTITEVEEETVLVEVSEDVEIRIAKSSIARTFTEHEEPEEEEETEEEEEITEEEESEDGDGEEEAAEEPEDSEKASKKKKK